MSFSEVFKLTAVSCSGTIPDESRQSLPIPTLQKTRLVIVTLFFPTELAPNEGTKIGAPDYVADVDYDAKHLDSLRRVKPSDFGLKDPADAPLGTFNTPANMTPEQFFAARDELFQLLDQLVPLYRKGVAPVTPEACKQAKRCAELYMLLMEKPAASYYEKSGSDFFHWLAPAN